ncbi:hypothetical protein K469DRAFT_631665 [Zopfia rhizophila CBS 207.26]|uniref:Cell wall protein n=1 Tax=Zopfia rhizophila CBS 207.26 TaxID=1314779 RepID=A0A6A6E4T7_9PEZI|nr:hypothetical protein K469DRAFT_631665 [Zopfia rhizophila CBS 207.26]
MKILAILFIAGTAFAFPAPTQGTQKPNCSAQQVQQLSDGIQANLDIQKQELQGVLSLQQLVHAANNSTQNAGNATSTNSCTPSEAQAQAEGEFVSEQKKVLDIQTKGIQIRAENQKIAAQLNSPAASGLAVVAMAQVLEMMQVQMLKGGGNNDVKLLNMLVKEVNDGTKQNEMNKMAAESQQCEANQ